MVGEKDVVSVELFVAVEVGVVEGVWVGLSVGEGVCVGLLVEVEVGVGVDV